LMATKCYPLNYPRKLDNFSQFSLWQTKLHDLFLFSAF
jgi:hypothetical protein